MFQAKDGPFNMAVATEDMWPKLCRLVGLPELAQHPDFSDNNARMKNRAALKRVLNEKFAARGKMEWTLDLVKLGLPAGPIFSLDQVFSDPHVNETRMIEEIEHPRLGKLRVLANPIRIGPMAGRSVRTPPPALGQDSRQVLHDYGFAAERIERLISEKVVLDAR